MTVTVYTKQRGIEEYFGITQIFRKTRILAIFGNNRGYSWFLKDVHWVKVVVDG